MAEAICGMIIHHPASLHEGVANCTAHKGEPALFEVLAHPVALGRIRRHLGE